VLIVAGEASGDLHAARLLAELSRVRRDLAPFGLGGRELAAAGLERLADSAEITVVGITEVLKILPRAREIFRHILAEVEGRKPPLAVLVDFPEFNLRLARELAARGVKVVYYISPQVWAWRRGRVRQIARIVDRMLVLFPFEVDFYSRAGVAVTCVGHPLVDEVPELPHIWETTEIGADGSPTDGQPFRLALLPGSRPSEVEALLPGMLRTVEKLGRRFPIHPVLIQAPTVPAARIGEAIRNTGVDLEIVREDRFSHLARCHLALCASGTATLELGLLGTPMVVLYRLQRWTYWLARLLVRVTHFSLVNLVLEREAVPELVQRGVAPDNVATVVGQLLGDPERIRAQRRDLAEIRQRLGRAGAARRAAEEVAREMPPPRHQAPPASSPGQTREGGVDR